MRTLARLVGLAALSGLLGTACGDDGMMSRDTGPYRIDAGMPADAGLDGGTVDGGDDAGSTGCAEPCGVCGTCVEGACRPVEDGRGCGGGTCRAGGCCTGCWDGVRCQDGDTLDHCGASGVTCRDCACEGDGCDEGACIPSTPVTAVSAGETVSCALDTNGEVLCFGRNQRGQTGHGTFDGLTTEPVGVRARTAVPGAGSEHACAIDTDGALWCWGASDRGQLGDGSFGPDQSRPVPIAGSLAWSAVTLSAGFGCALAGSGELSCWGAGDAGQLGIGSAADVPVPIAVEDRRFRHVSTGGRHVCGVELDGTLWCWGDNRFAQLGLGVRGSTSGRNTPTLVDEGTSWWAIAAGGAHTCALRTDLTLWCWGDNSEGQLGLGSRFDLRWPWRTSRSSDWIQIDAGDRHTCGVNARGAVLCWGEGANGRLGVGDTLDRLDPTAVGYRTDWAQVSAGHAHTCAVDEHGGLYCWGEGGDGALGLGDTAGRLVPARACLPTG